jgi:hypothetical protein
MTVNDYNIIDSFRKNLEIFLEAKHKQLTTKKVSNIYSEINRLRTHLNMTKY